MSVCNVCVCYVGNRMCGACVPFHLWVLEVQVGLLDLDDPTSKHMTHFDNPIHTRSSLRFCKVLYDLLCRAASACVWQHCGSPHSLVCLAPPAGPFALVHPAGKDREQMLITTAEWMFQGILRG